MSGLLGKELAALGALVDRAAFVRLAGSFSERNPLLGPMVRCPHCGRRRRRNQELPCCSAKQGQRTRAGKARTLVVRTDSRPKAQEWRQGPKVRPGGRHTPMSVLRTLHQLLIEWSRDESVQGRLTIRRGGKPRPPVKADHRPSFALKYLEAEIERKAKVARRRQRESRRANRRKG